DACRRDVPGRTAQAVAAGQPERLLLYSGPYQRKIPGRQSFRQETDLGEKDRSGWTARAGGRLAADGGRGPDMSFDGRCVQLDVHGLSPRHGTFLSGSAGEVQCFQQEQGMVETRPILLWRVGPARTGRSAAKIYPRHRSADGKDRVGL